MISLLIAMFIAIRCVLVSAHGFRFINESSDDRFIDEMQRENFFINVLKVHKWTYDQFYPKVK